MFKRTALLITLCLPLFAHAADANERKGAPRGGDKASAPVAAASAPGTKGPRQKVDHSAEMQRVHTRGATMGACTKQAADQKLNGIERKQFIARCVNGQ